MFDLSGLAHATQTHGTLARVVIAHHDGSSPRETGASMLVWGTKQSGGQSGTIGGGALEWQATETARAMLTSGGTRLDRHPLGPKLGQCCGGAVTLLTEVFTKATLPTAVAGLIARPTDGTPMPLAVKRLLDRARARGETPGPQLIQGWMVEPVARPTGHLWIWGAGHVGRALVQVMAPLPDLAITWIDTAPERFPETVPPNVRALPAPAPETATALAPPDADHLILTFSHALDLELCHRLLSHGFASAGLIGSATKWARFRSRLAALGHPAEAIARISCPIGDPALGKHPQAIAISVAAAFLRQPRAAQAHPVATGSD
jgi:xanthine dehydrogenase accessory factor